LKYKDYYKTFGLQRSANPEEIKKTYRKLARKYHPDVSKEKNAEEKFKEVQEAYQTLSDPEKKSAYDQLGTHQPGQEFRPPPDWRSQFDESTFASGDIDLSDLLASLHRRQRPQDHRAAPQSGQDYEVAVHISLEDAYRGTEVELDLSMPEFDAQGIARRTPHSFKARIPKGATDAQRLRIPGKGGKGFNGGPNGDLYLNISLHPHRLFRASGHDLYLDLPLAPWEAVLGATIEVPTLGGAVRLKVPPGAHATQQLRLPKRGLPKPGGGEGDLFAIIQIAVPTAASDRERALFKQLADESAFNPRGHFT
jgi:curved DNA-binding protein